mgnify:CR=1 FL=1
MNNYYDKLQNGKNTNTIAVLYPVDRENLIYDEYKKKYHYFAPLSENIEVGDIVAVGNNGATNYVLVVEVGIPENKSGAKRSIEYKTTYADALAEVTREREMKKLKAHLEQVRYTEEEVAKYEPLLQSSDPTIVEMAQRYIKYLRGE